MEINLEDKNLVFDITEEEGERCWLVVKEEWDGKIGVTMARDMFGDMSSVETLDGGELLLAERFTEEEAEVKCIEMSKKLGLPFFDFGFTMVDGVLTYGLVDRSKGN